MKKIIEKRTYNTETADLVKTKTVSYFGDPTGYEESLYKTKKGLHFVYGVGGKDSKYPEENIIAVSEKEAAEF